MKDEEDRLEVVREELEEREREIEERERETAKSGERFAFLPVCWCSIGLLQVFSLAPASLRSKILRNLSQGRVQFPPLPLKRLRHLENHVTPCALIRQHARRIAFRHCQRWKRPSHDLRIPISFPQRWRESF